MGVNVIEIYNRTRVPLEEKAVIRLVGAVLDAEAVRGAELAVEFVGERRMRALNREYRGRDEVTDVLSFPLEEAGEGGAGPSHDGGTPPPRLLGDVVVCARRALRQAELLDQADWGSLLG